LFNPVDIYEYFLIFLVGAILHADSLGGYPQQHDGDEYARLTRKLLSEWVQEYEGAPSTAVLDCVNEHNMPTIRPACYNQYPNMTKCGIATCVNVENMIGKLRFLEVSTVTVANSMNEVLMESDKTDQSIIRFRESIYNELETNSTVVSKATSDPNMFCDRCGIIVHARKEAVKKNPPRTNFGSFSR